MLTYQNTYDGPSLSTPEHRRRNWIDESGRHVLRHTHITELKRGSDVDLIVNSQTSDERLVRAFDNHRLTYQVINRFRDDVGEWSADPSGSRYFIPHGYKGSRLWETGSTVYMGEGTSFEEWYAACCKATYLLPEARIQKPDPSDVWSALYPIAYDDPPDPRQIDVAYADAAYAEQRSYDLRAFWTRSINDPPSVWCEYVAEHGWPEPCADPADNQPTPTPEPQWMTIEDTI
jgi:hypothetical protein